MPQTDITQTSQTSTNTIVTDFSVDHQTTDGISDQKETEWPIEDWSKWYGFYKTIPEYKTAINAYATWVLGKGFVSQDAKTDVQLGGIKGWGEDTFNDILWNMIVVKKVGGDAFAEAIRDVDTGELTNLKPLDPSSITIVVDRQGIIQKYKQTFKTGKDKTGTRDIEVQDMLHLCNDRVADNIHGTAVTEAIEWVILARNEAMQDWRRISHRSTIRVLYIDEDDKTRFANLKSDYAEAIKNGEVIIIPGKPGENQFQDLNLPPADSFISWIKYLENFFYQALGIPKVILGGSEEFTEASSKISYLTYEQVYTKEVVDMEADLWNQLGIKITFNKPASLKSEMLSSEDKNKAQTGFQPNDVEAGVGK